MVMEGRMITEFDSGTIQHGQPLNEQPIAGKRLGKLPRMSDRRALMLASFMPQIDPAKLPKATHFWPRRKGFPLDTYGNNDHGCCTRASQAHAIMRMERIEQRRTVEITTDEVLSRYYDMTQRLYGGGDTGAYEIDALREWRNPDLTLRDVKGRPHTIDAYTALNPANINELKFALATSGAHGIKVCLNLPAAFQRINPPQDWDCPADNDPRSRDYDWRPGTWGGHSMKARDYDEIGLWLVHTWGFIDQRITWRAVARYVDEAHLYIDSVNSWKRQRRLPSRTLAAIVDAVNQVSDIKLRAA
jgi:hypothetical protein